jgi:hypothetical protein
VTKLEVVVNIMPATFGLNLKRRMKMKLYVLDRDYLTVTEYTKKDAPKETLMSDVFFSQLEAEEALEMAKKFRYEQAERLYARKGLVSADLIVLERG